MSELCKAVYKGLQAVIITFSALSDSLNIQWPA